MTLIQQTCDVLYDFIKPFIPCDSLMCVFKSSKLNQFLCVFNYVSFNIKATYISF